MLYIVLAFWTRELKENMFKTDTNKQQQKSNLNSILLLGENTF